MEPEAGIQPRADAGGGAGLVIRGIRKNFGAAEVLRGVDFSVPAGEFVTLLGPSGCGKTTLLRIIAGLELADAGEIELGGATLAGLPAHKRPINTVFQNYALFPHLNVFENVAFGLRARKFADAEVRRRVEGALEMLQIGDLRARDPGALSGGQKQRAALARALVNEPELLLLDEPMSALDARLRAEIQLELRRLQRRLGRTFILVTHDQEEALVVSDRIAVMHGGRILQSGAPGDVYERPADRFIATFLGNANLIEAEREGEGFATALGRLAADAPAGWTRGALAIRPERVKLGAAPGEPNSFAARVRDRVFRGDCLDLFLEPCGLRARTAPRSDLRPGDEVRIALPREHLRALRD